jgi:hypothetical protein
MCQALIPFGQTNGLNDRPVLGTRAFIIESFLSNNIITSSEIINIILLFKIYTILS